jgi:hypothetical protein
VKKKPSPYRRLITGEATDCDVEWVKMLEEIFNDVDLHGFRRVGVPQQNLNKLLSILSLSERLQDEQLFK